MKSGEDHMDDQLKRCILTGSTSVMLPRPIFLKLDWRSKQRFSPTTLVSRVFAEGNDYQQKCPSERGRRKRKKGPGLLRCPAPYCGLRRWRWCVYGKGCLSSSHLVVDLQWIRNSVAKAFWQLRHLKGKGAITACRIHIPVYDLAFFLFTAHRVLKVHLPLLGTEELPRYGDLFRVYATAHREIIQYHASYGKGVRNDHGISYPP